MKFNPCGFQVLIEMDVVEKEVKEGALAGFQLASNTEHEREQTGHDVGKLVAFGPQAYKGFGCSEPEEWGVSLGDIVEFRRYDGKIPRNDENGRYRVINDSDVILRVEG